MELWHAWACPHCMRVRAALADIAKLPPDWRSAQLGLEGLARWVRAVMRRPTVREQMGPKLAMAG